MFDIRQFLKLYYDNDMLLQFQNYSTFTVIIHLHKILASLYTSFCFSKPMSQQDQLIGRERAFESLYADLGVVSRWGDVNRTTFNAGKAQYISFTNRAPITDSSIQFIGSDIPCSSLIDVLGVRITENLSSTEHI